MAHSSGSSAIHADRRRERMRRGELAAQPEEDIPSFPSEPRRITAERQDSLTNRIEHVLGDINEVQKHLGSEPNIWLGTSRNQQNLSRSQTYRNQGPQNHSSRTKPQSNSSVYSPAQDKSQIGSKRRDESSQQNNFYPKYQSSNLSRHNHNNNTSDRISSTPLPDHKGRSKSPRNGITEQAHNRERLQSVDMPVAVENIFKEMLQMNEPLSEIQTPNIGQEFNFVKSETKIKEEPKEKSHAVRPDLEDNAATMSSSDENSSDESDEESDDSDAEEGTNKWVLSGYLDDSAAANDSVTEQKPEAAKQKNAESSHSSTRKAVTRGRPSERKNSVDTKTRNSSSRSSSVKGKTDEKSSERSKSASKGRLGSSHRSSPVRSQSLQRPTKPSSKAVQDVKRNNNKQSPLSERKSPAPKPSKQSNEQSANRNCNNSMLFSVSNETSSQTPSDQRHRVGQKSPMTAIKNHGRIAEKKHRGVSPSSQSSSDSSCSGSEDEKSPAQWNSFRERSNSSSSNKPSVHSKKQNNSKSSIDRRSAPSALAKPDMDRRKPPKPDQSNLRPPISQHDVKHRHPRSNESTPTSQETREGSVAKQPNPQSRPKSKKSSKQRRSVSSPVTNEPKPSSFPSLWVRILPSSSNDPEESYPDNHAPMDTSQPEPRPRLSTNRTAAVSTGSETEKPLQRAKNVQVAVAASSSDWSPRTAMNKRKHNQPYDSTSVADQKSKRRKQETPSPTNSQGRQPTHSIAASESSQHSRKENFQWKDRRKGSRSPHNPTWNQEPTYNQNQPSSYHEPANNIRPPPVKLETCQSTSHSASAGVASIVSEPDSSWPEQEKLLKSDQYMRDGKRLKHEGDAFTDSRTGRTRVGESLSRALVYYDAALCFIMNGYTLELENGNDRNESGSSHSPTSMYHQTISLMDYIRKMRPHDDTEELAFKRLNLSCIRSQALLFLRIYKLKKDIANKYSEILNDQFKQTGNKSNRTPSPWHNVSGQNVVSPMSPAVPSPYGITIPGPSPVAGSTNYEPVSSSTQVSKMTSPPTSSTISVAPKLYDIIKHYHSITRSLMLAHEKWEQAEALQKEQVLSGGGTDFFRNVETLCGRTLMLHSSLRDLVTYNKVVLHQLRAIKSPHD
ncbi:uncharacterized protein LOC100178614 isoform X1 [Ciona intestinalis]